MNSEQSINWSSSACTYLRFSGNDYKVILSQFEQLYSLPPGPNGYDLTVLTPFRASRFEQSIQNNPYFFNGPFSGVAVQPAAYTFIYRFMSNKSAEYPEGYLDGDVLKSFFGITGEPGSFTWDEGTERIPDNWYKVSHVPRFKYPSRADIVSSEPSAMSTPFHSSAWTWTMRLYSILSS